LAGGRVVAKVPPQKFVRLVIGSQTRCPFIRQDTFESTVGIFTQHIPGPWVFYAFERAGIITRHQVGDKCIA
jgi:hypothetical protein